MILATLMILSMSCIYLPLQHLNPVILREYLHLADGNSIESCQPFRLGHPFTDKYGVQVFFDRIGVNTVVNFDCCINLFLFRYHKTVHLGLTPKRIEFDAFKIRGCRGTPKHPETQSSFGSASSSG